MVVARAPVAWSRSIVVYVLVIVALIIATSVTILILLAHGQSAARDAADLIDFEYAALSSPILDLAGLAGFNHFDTDQRARLIGAYYGHYDVPFSADELHDAIRLVRLLSYFWALSHGGAGKSNEDLAIFADAMAAMLR